MALSQREKALILIPVALGAVLGFYSYVHEPLMAKRAEAENKLETVERELKQGQRQLAQEGDLEARRQAVAAREQVVDASVPGKNAAALFVWYLGQAEMRSGGHVKSVKVADRRAVDPADPKKQVQSLNCGTAAGSGAQSGQTSGASGSGQSGAANGQGGSTNPQSGSSNQQSGGTNQQSGSTNPQGGSTNGQPSGAQGQPSGAATNGSASGCGQAIPAGSIVVLSVELKLAGKFGEQLHFAQMLEEMPLFLANDQIALVRTSQTDWQKASGLIGQGKAGTAYNLLASSPVVEGSYQIQLYFKQGKAGPATSDMSFSSEPGRKDPFLQDGVNEFTKYVEDAYNGRGFAPSPENPEQFIPVPQQLG